MVDEAVHFLSISYAGDGRRQPAQHRSGRVRRMVRRRFAQQSRHVPLAVDRRKVSVGGGRDRRRPQRLSHQRAARTSLRCVPRAGNGSPPRACTGAAIAAPTSSICATTRSTATCPSSRPKSRSNASMPGATSATRSRPRRSRWAPSPSKMKLGRCASSSATTWTGHATCLSSSGATRHASTWRPAICARCI